MEKFSVAILIFICLAAAVDAVTVRCAFGSRTWPNVTGSFYQCTVQNREVFTASLVSIDGAVGTHTGDHVNDDVTEFTLDSVPNLVHFPKNLEKVFPDLEAIQIYSTKLQAITQDDLKVFPRLKAAYFGYNQLKAITADTFRFNPKLEVIYLNNNLIFHIEPQTFDGLRRLAGLYLNDNDDNCRLTNAATKSDTATFVQKINNRKCYSLAYEVQQKLERFIKDVQQMWTRIQVLTKKVENHK
jgi:hypothetical protein